MLRQHELYAQCLITPPMIRASLGIKVEVWVLGPGSLIVDLLVNFYVSCLRLMVFKHIEHTITHKPYIEIRTEWSHYN